MYQPGAKKRVTLILIALNITLFGCSEGSVSGRVFDENNNSIPGVTVDLYTETILDWPEFCFQRTYRYDESTITDENGAYSFENLSEFIPPVAGCPNSHENKVLAARKNGYILGSERGVEYINDPPLHGARFKFMFNNTVNFLAFEEEGDPDSSFLFSYPESGTTITTSIGDEITFHINLFTNPLLEHYVTWGLYLDSERILHLGTFNGDEDFIYNVNSSSVIDGAQLIANLYTRHWHRGPLGVLVFGPSVVDTLFWDVVVE